MDIHAFTYRARDGATVGDRLEMPGLITIVITEHLDDDSDRDWLKRRIALEPEDLKRFVSDVGAVIDRAGEDDPDDT